MTKKPVGSRPAAAEAVAIRGRLCKDAREILAGALAECAPEKLIASLLRRREGHLEGPGFRLKLGRRTPLILSYGKASVAMARGLVQLLSPGAVDGFMVHPGASPSTSVPGLRPLPAAHPFPDERSFEAGRLLRERVRLTEKEDPVIHLISGGGSALAASPLEEVIGQREKTMLHRLLVQSDLGIRDINVVRKHFSAIKGGRLLLCNPGAQHLSLILSDVPGGIPEAVAGGPTLPDPSTRDECLRILKDSKVLGELPARLQRRLEGREVPETPRPRDPRFRRHRWTLLASGEELVASAAACARRLGYRVHRLSGTIEEPVDQAVERLLLERDRMLVRGTGPFCIVAGGEARVRAGSREGRGGRAQEMAAAAAIRLRGAAGCLFLAAGSDGVDGNSPAAGAVADGTTHARAWRKGLSIPALRRERNTYRLFNALDDSIVTGSTGNNLRDLYLLLEIPHASRTFKRTRGDRQGWRGKEKR